MMRLDVAVAPAFPEFEAVRREVWEVDGVRLSRPHLDVACAVRLTNAVARCRDALLHRDAAGIAHTLGRVGARFSDAGDPLRREALELLPATAAISPQMARAVLDGMSADWTAGALGDLIGAELEDPACLDDFRTVRGRRVMAVGPRLSVQIVAGSVPGVGVQALVRSLLIKSPTVLKPGAGDIVLPVLFARALADEDPGLAEALAVVYWPGGSAAVEAAFLEAADAVVAYGSDATVRELRDRTPIRARFVGYRHRSGVGVVGRDALEDGQGVERVAADIARAVALFDQRGCVSPHVVHVETGGAETIERLARAVAAALGALSADLPSGPLDRERAAVLQQLRGTAEILAASGTLTVLHGGGEASWTVLAGSRTKHLELGGGRTVALRPFDSLAVLGGRLAEDRDSLQSLGLAGFLERRRELARVCGIAGVSRVVPLAAMAFPPARWLHDGRGPLVELIRWVELSGPDEPGA